MSNIGARFFSSVIKATKNASISTKAVAGASAATGTIFGFKYYQTYGDKVISQDNYGKSIPVLKAAEASRQSGSSTMQPWVTTDPELLHSLKENFPQHVLPNPHELVPPYLTPVKICPVEMENSNHSSSFVAVGGFPAAVMALRKCLEGHSDVVYVNYKGEKGKMMRAISDGAAWHFEPEAFTEAPAYCAGKNPTVFFKNEVYEFIFPSRFDSAASGNVLAPNHRWLSLNVQDWLYNPSQWLEGFRIAWGNQILSWQYASEIKQGKTPKVIEEMTLRTKQSEQIMTKLNEVLGGKLFLGNKKGSLIIFSTPESAEDFPAMQKSLRAEGRDLILLTQEEVKKKYGFTPANAYQIAEKTEDRIINPDAIELISREIEKRGGIVRTDLRLSEIQVDKNNPINSGVVVFEGPQKSVFKQSYSELYSSLGFTDYTPHQSDLSSVRGVSVTAIISGIEMTGGPIVCDSQSSVHLVPISSTVNGKTLVRITEGAHVGPRNLGENAYHLRTKDLVNLEHLARKILPEGATVQIVSAIGCNRAFAPEGAMSLKHPVISIDGQKKSISNVVIMQGAGGGGITQGGAPASFS